MKNKNDFPIVQQNIDYFLAHKEELMKKYKNKYILIFDEKVMKSSEDMLELSIHGRDTYGLGNFCIQFC